MRRDVGREGWIEGKGYRKRVLFDANDLNCPGSLVQMVEIAPRTSVPLHYHRTSVEVFHILEGSGRMRIGEVEHRLRVGDTVRCAPPSVHDAHNDSDGVWRYIVFKTNASQEDLFWVEEDQS